ncbi:unnamed protein product, partial [Clonostachys rhizophaga]
LTVQVNAPVSDSDLIYRIINFISHATDVLYNTINERESQGDRARDPELPAYLKPDVSIVGKASRPGIDTFPRIYHTDNNTTIKLQPTRYIDYLLYNWKEEDI